MVFPLANQTALEWHHEYVDTEHVLIGMIREGSGVGIHVLRNLGIDMAKLRAAAAKATKMRPGKTSAGKLPYTPLAKNLIEYATEEARILKAKYVGTEHMLLGLLRVQEGVAAQVLVSLGVKMDRVREEIRGLLSVRSVATGGSAEENAGDLEMNEVVSIWPRLSTEARKAMLVLMREMVLPRYPSECAERP